MKTADGLALCAKSSEVIDWLARVLQGYLTGTLVELCSPPGSGSWPTPSRRSRSPILARWRAMRS